MSELEIRFLKTHEDAKLPHCGRIDPLTGDSGYDLYCVEPAIIEPKGSDILPVGLTVAYITPGFWFKIEARSGLGFKHGIAPHNGILDNQYRGDCGVKLYNHSNKPMYIEKGDRVAQIVVYPLLQPNISWSDEIEQTERGEKGFGSSGS